MAWEITLSESQDFVNAVGGVCREGVLHRAIVAAGITTLEGVERGRANGQDLDPSDANAITLCFSSEPTNGEKVTAWGDTINPSSGLVETH